MSIITREILKDLNLTAQRQSSTIALLIAEPAKLSEDAEHPEFVQSKVAGSHHQVAQATSRRDSLAVGTFTLSTFIRC
jgi:hypothetical protein